MAISLCVDVRSSAMDSVVTPDLEAAKAAAMNGILDAARRGERNAERLRTHAIEAIRRYEELGIEPQLRAAAL